VVSVRGSEFPDYLLYDVPNQVWYEPLADGTVRAGMTAVAVELAGDVLAFTPKRIGREFEKGRSFATFESGKWVGPARAAFDGTVVACNEALMEQPRIINRDPYKEGWMLVVRPGSADWRKELVTGAAIAPAFEAWMDAEGYERRAR
jgi:glycine cleavage system H protein